MTQRVLGPTRSRARATRTSLLMMALMGLVLGVLIGGGGVGAAAPGPSVAEYSQCANGKAGTSVPTTDCDAWINGILNPNNSQYREDQVTAQRLFVDGLSVGSHSFEFSYLVRKGNGHAYDSLATWDYTQTGANPCQGLNGPALTNCTADVINGTPSTLDIDPDGLVVNSPCTVNPTTSDHQLPGQVFTMFGGNLVAMEYVGTASDSEGLYQRVKIDFNKTSAGRVYFLFGGHLAAGLTPAQGSPRGWGDNCGASSISGGPYHIKLNFIDGASAGNRDNQIMSNAVLPLITPTLSTDPDAAVEYKATLSDSLDVANSNAAGTARFLLFDDLTECQGGDPADAIFDSGNKTVSGGEASSGDHVIDPGPESESIYYWFVSYSGDPAENLGPATSECDETATITPPGAETNP